MSFFIPGSVDNKAGKVTLQFSLAFTLCLHREWLFVDVCRILFLSGLCM